jgi:hypothetical protein
MFNAWLGVLVGVLVGRKSTAAAPSPSWLLPSPGSERVGGKAAAPRPDAHLPPEEGAEVSSALVRGRQTSPASPPFP